MGRPELGVRADRVAPDLSMSLCGLSIKRCHPPIGNIGQPPIFFNVQLVFHQIADFHRLTRCRHLRCLIAWSYDKLSSNSRSLLSN